MREEKEDFDMNIFASGTDWASSNLFPTIKIALGYKHFRLRASFQNKLCLLTKALLNIYILYFIYIYIFFYCHGL